MKDFIEQRLADAAVAQEILQEHQRIVAGNEQQLQQQRVGSEIRLAVTAAGGRNLKAIAALMDSETIARAEDTAAAAKQAVAAVKRENPYLFSLPAVTAPGTGTGAYGAPPSAEDIASMSLREYRRFRKGV